MYKRSAPTSLVSWPMHDNRESQLVTDIRYRNFQTLMQIYAETAGDQTLRGFAKRIDVAEPYLSQVRNRAKTVGPKLARRLEEKFDCTPGWMDVRHDPADRQVIRTFLGALIVVLLGGLVLLWLL